jgi:hypothetical protein
MGIEYDHDLDVSKQFTEIYPLISGALRDERLISAFRLFDKEVRKHKRAFEALGLCSLLLGLLPLLTSAIRLSASEALFARLSTLNIITNSCGALAIALVLWTRLKRHRRKWCQAVFCRERLRQWHFQLFLDGSFIGLWSSQRVEFEQELNRRWVSLEQNFHDGYGMMTQFVNFASHGDDLFHEPTKYSHSTVADQVFNALLTLRLNHQLRYTRRKIETDGEEPAGFALPERTILSETIATVTLSGAVLATSLALFLPLLQLNPMFDITLIQTLDRSIAGAALVLAIISAASRAYRAGFTLPDELESYAESCDRFRELRAQFAAVSTDYEKLRYLKYIEEESAAELRRFLRMKLRATFLF